jgi:hypothetical protein
MWDLDTSPIPCAAPLFMESLTNVAFDITLSLYYRRPLSHISTHFRVSLALTWL